MIAAIISPDIVAAVFQSRTVNVIMVRLAYTLADRADKLKTFRSLTVDVDHVGSWYRINNYGVLHIVVDCSTYREYQVRCHHAVAAMKRSERAVVGPINSLIRTSCAMVIALANRYVEFSVQRCSLMHLETTL